MIKSKRKLVSVLLVLSLVPITMAVLIIFGAEAFMPLSVIISAFAVLAFLLRFETKRIDIGSVVVISIMSALAIAGRILFTPFPGFKPVCAIIILCAVYMGSEAGFLCGVLVTAISNFSFGHGPWTPVQMIVWGLIGFGAGMLSSGLKKSRIALCIYGAVSGVVFSLLMDVWTVIWMSGEGSLGLSSYGSVLVYALSFTALYAVSNIVFLLLLIKPVGNTLLRLKTKYGIGT